MEYNKPIRDIKTGDEVEGFYILKTAVNKVSTTGKPFLAASISDCTGSMDLKAWDYAGPIGQNDVGKVIKIRGQVSDYKDTLQFNAQRIRLANESDDYDRTKLVATAPIDIDARIAEVENLIASIEDGSYRRVAEIMYQRHKDAFRNIPASKTFHHGFISGLLMHTSNMMRIADFLSGLYSDTVDRSLLLCGTLLHDFAKEKEYDFSELGIVSDYSVKGELLGHLVMGAQEVAEVAKETGMNEEKAVLLQHLILSHHGLPEYGAAVVPKCAEADLLNYIDLIDSRMEIYDETFASVPVGEFSQKIYALDKKIFHHK